MCGSGTTPAVAHRLGRRYIGIDQNKNYCEMAMKRVKEENSQIKTTVKESA